MLFKKYSSFTYGEKGCQGIMLSQKIWEDNEKNQQVPFFYTIWTIGYINYIFFKK